MRISNHLVSKNKTVSGVFSGTSNHSLQLTESLTVSGAFSGTSNHSLQLTESMR